MTASQIALRKDNTYYPNDHELQIVNRMAYQTSVLELKFVK